MKPNNPYNFSIGEEVYSVSLNTHVIIHTLGSSSAYCLDSDTDDGHLLPLSDLRPISNEDMEQLR